MKHTSLLPTCVTGFGTLLMCLAFCSSAYSYETHFASGKSALAIPFDLDDNLIYVRVGVNGSQPLSFILDTGAFSIINTQHARSIGLKLKLIGQAAGVGANQPDVHLVTEKVSFSLPGVTPSGQRLVAVPLDAVEACVNEFVVDERGRNVPSARNSQGGAKRDVDGILGKEFFDHFVVEIDYAKRLINVYDRSSYKYVGKGKGIPLEMGAQHIFMQAQITASGRTPVTGRFLIDTGSALAVSLTQPFIEKHNLLPATEGMTSIPVCGLGGYADQKSWVGTLEALEFSGLKIVGPVTEYRVSTPTTDADGFIGGAVFRHFKVIFDYSRRRMILEPKSELK